MLCCCAAQDRAEEDKKRKLRKLMRSGHLKLMPIVRMKLWAKRAVARVKGYHHSSGRSERYRSLVHEYVIAANNVS